MTTPARSLRAQLGEANPVKTYRVLAGVGAIALLLAGLVNPSDSPAVALARYATIGAMASLLLLSYVSPWARRHLGWGAYVVNTLVVVYLCTMLYTTRIDAESMIASFVGVLICGMVMHRIVLVIVFLATATVIHIATVFAVADPIIGPMAFIINLVLYAVFVGLLLSMQIAAREKRLQTESIMGAIFDQSSDALLYGDIEGFQVFRANPEAARLFRTEDLNQMGRLTRSAFIERHQGSDLQRALELALADPGWEETMEFRTAAGSSFWGNLALRRLELDGRNLLMARITDVTADRKREAALEEAKEAAEAAAVARSQFLANMSHEIRTPMNGVIGVTSLLLNTQLDEDQSRYVEMVRSSGESLLTIINEILDFSKLEANQVHLENARFDAEDVAIQALHVLTPLASSKGLELILRMDPTEHRFFYGDAQRLRQVLVNLLSNAVKFTSEGEVMLAVSTVPRDDAPWELHFAVQDSGIGIDLDNGDELFEPFVQADASTTRRYGGTGLGLSISKNLVALMGGTLSVSSELGYGSTFSFHVLVEPAAARPRAEEGALKSRRVHVAEMNPLALDVLCATLDTVGMQTRPFPSARALLDDYEPGCCDLIIADPRGLSGDGVELVTALRRKDPNLVPVILLTALESRDADKADIAALVRKPIRTSHLIQTMEFVLGAEIPPADGSDAEPADIADFHHMRVLVAEDHPANQLVVSALLKKLGIQPEMVDDGEAVVDATRRRDYDLVLMDIQMPRKDGLQATREIRQQGTPDQPYIVAMTANALVSDRAACAEAGMNDFIAKPVRMEDLQRRLRTAAAKARDNGDRRG